MDKNSFESKEQPGPFFERFLKMWTQRDSAEKTLKFGLNAISSPAQGLHADTGSLQDLIKRAQNPK